LGVRRGKETSTHAEAFVPRPEKEYTKKRGKHGAGFWLGEGSVMGEK